MRRIGVDAVGVERIALAMRRSGQGFLAKALTPAEIEYCAGRSEKVAGRWAAKEAVIKCFDGTPICFPRRRIEILPGPTGAPRVRLIGDARGARVAVSITHHSGLAVASATLEMLDGSGELASAPEDVVMPVRPANAHKGTFGTVVVLAGSLGLTGAAYLCSTAAARGGAGMVRLLVAEALYPILATKCTEVMATPLPEVAPGAVGHSGQEAILRSLAPAAAFAVGPGLGRDSSTWRLIHDLLPKVSCPTVVDADGLNALAANPGLKGQIGERRVLTPHPGEMSRLLAMAVPEIEKDRAGCALEAARIWGAVVVLKGSETVVAAPDGRLSLNPHSVPALATGGTGDVLTGLVASLLAQGLDPFRAAVSAVYVHAEAGRRVAERQGDSGLLASDLLPEIPLVMKVLREGGL